MKTVYGRLSQVGRSLHRAVVLALVLVLALTTASLAGTRIPQVVAEHGMVATAHTLASQAGLEILKRGGNAVDAAVASAFAIGVVEPNATSIGGEGMMVLYLADKKQSIAIDYRSSAPAKAVGAFPKGIPGTGHAAVATPGAVAGLALALQKYGTMSLEQVMAPAIRLAEEGFVVSPTLADIITDNFDALSKNAAMARVYLPEGMPIEAGQVLKNPDLAATLRKIAQGGADVFYRGEIADRIASEMAANGGLITKEDLAAYRAIERTPVRGSYRGFELISAPPPVGGLSVVEILQILENFDLAKNPRLSAANIHLMAEAMKRGFADNSAYVGDPDFVDVPVAGLLSKQYAKDRAAEIKADAVTPKVVSGEAVKYESPSTTALSVVDGKGNMVALTQTISDFFGAKVIIEGTGIVLNNEMKNFSAKGPNAMAAGKRMRTTIAPTIVVKDGKTFATMGTPGAARIISTMVILVSNLVDYKMGIQEAIEAPRFYVRDTEKDISIESRIDKDVRDQLTGLGYSIKVLGDYDLFFGGAQAIIIDPATGKLYGGADPRRDGAVLGF